MRVSMFLYRNIFSSAHMNSSPYANKHFKHKRANKRDSVLKGFWGHERQIYCHSLLPFCQALTNIFHIYYFPWILASFGDLISDIKYNLTMKKYVFVHVCPLKTLVRLHIRAVSIWYFSLFYQDPQMSHTDIEGSDQTPQMPIIRLSHILQDTYFHGSAIMFPIHNCIL